MPGWAHEEYAEAIYSVSRAPPTYSTDDWGDLSHSYVKIITINIKLRFKDRRKNFQGTIFFCSCSFCSMCTVQSNAVNTGTKGCIEGVCINWVSVLTGLTLEKI